MKQKTIQDFLNHLEMPSRYLGDEFNTVKKNFNDDFVKIVLAFPDLYEIGTSHFGIQILYHILNKNPNFLAERVYAPAPDAATILKKEGVLLTSMENDMPLHKFDVVGFSLLYELNYSNVLYMMDLASLPFRREKRNETHPLIIAGGPCTGNPEPTARFFDAVVIGDGEVVIEEMMEIVRHLKKRENNNFKNTVITEWSKLTGVYTPSLFKEYKDEKTGFIYVKKNEKTFGKNDDKVIRAVCADLNEADFPVAPIIPYGKPVHDRLRIEIARGCTRGCRFCQAGMFYRPVRERTPDNVLKMTEEALAETGYDDISLLSLSTGDYTAAAETIKRVMDLCEPRHIAVSLPSLRADSITEDLMKHIKRVRKTGFTIAPEAGSQRLRQVINKNLTEDDILKTVETAFELGWQTIKLYFMIGLPTETEEDLEALLELVKKIRAIKREKNKRGKIHVSVSSFIPKSHTPFQWERQMTFEESKAKIRFLMDRLKFKDIQFKWQNPELSRLEGVFARGDRELSLILEKAFELGINFDGWSDYFRPDLWKKAFEETGIDPSKYMEKKDEDEILPWEHIHIGVSRKFLLKELNKARLNETTTDCKNGKCHVCGVCDFKKIAPNTYKAFETSQSNILNREQKEKNYIPLKIGFSKINKARFYGHIEMMNIFSRAFLRAGIPLKYSGGFHPVPRMVFKDTLPIGMDSLNEYIQIWIPDNVEPEIIYEKLNEELPEGLVINDCYVPKKQIKSMDEKEKNEIDHYVIKSQSPVFKSELYELFRKSNNFMIQKKSKKKITKLDLKDFVYKMNVTDAFKLVLYLKSVGGKKLRPKDIVSNIFQPDEFTQKQLRITKL